MPAALASMAISRATESLSDITRADLFQRAGEKTPVFVRFSTVAGNKGSPDLARDVRGFAVKFYTKEGNWDLVGNNIPVFFIQDAIKFPDIIHAAKQEPDRGFPQAQTAHDNFWDFISLTPESMHMALWIMSDRTIPRSFRFMEGFGVHTFRFVNAEGKSTFVKFHWKPKLGMQSVVWNSRCMMSSPPSGAVPTSSILRTRDGLRARCAAQSSRRARIPADRFGRGRGLCEREHVARHSGDRTGYLARRAADPGVFKQDHLAAHAPARRSPRDPSCPGCR